MNDSESVIDGKYFDYEVNGSLDMTSSIYSLKMIGIIETGQVVVMGSVCVTSAKRCACALSNHIRRNLHE